MSQFQTNLRLEWLLLFLIFLLKNLGSEQSTCPPVALAKCFARRENSKAAGCSGGVGGVCAWVLRNGMGGGTCSLG